MTWKHVRGPSGVSIVVLYFRAIFVTVQRCFPARVLSIEVSMTQRRRAQAEHVLGEEVVLDEPGVLGLYFATMVKSSS